MGYFVYFFGGIVSFLSPCILPVIPMYFGFLSGDINVEDKSKLYVNAVIFLLGFSLSSIMLSVLSNYIFKFIKFSEISKISGIVIVLMGLLQLGIVNLSLFSKEMKVNLKLPIGRKLSAFFIGFFFNLGWTPCMSPVLLPLLLLVGNGKLLDAIIGLIFYSLGFSIPFFLSAVLFAKFSTFFESSKDKLDIIKKISGIIIIVMGILMYTGSLNKLFNFF